MRIEENNNIREVIADDGKRIFRKGTEIYFSRCIMFSKDSMDDYEEINESDIPKEAEYENE